MTRMLRGVHRKFPTGVTIVDDDRRRRTNRPRRQRVLEHLARPPAPCSSASGAPRRPTRAVRRRRCGREHPRAGPAARGGPVRPVGWRQVRGGRVDARRERRAAPPRGRGSARGRDRDAHRRADAHDLHHARHRRGGVRPRPADLPGRGVLRLDEPRARLRPSRSTPCRPSRACAASPPTACCCGCPTWRACSRARCSAGHSSGWPRSRSCSSSTTRRGLADAGVAVGVFGGVGAAVSPALGRLVDRVGQVPVLTVRKPLPSRSLWVRSTGCRCPPPSASVPSPAARCRRSRRACALSGPSSSRRRRSGSRRTPWTRSVRS